MKRLLTNFRNTAAEIADKPKVFAAATATASLLAGLVAADLCNRVAINLDDVTRVGLDAGVGGLATAGVALGIVFVLG